MKVISLLTSKGGGGKSTTAMMLIDGLCQSGSVMVIDMDDTLGLSGRLSQLDEIGYVPENVNVKTAKSNEELYDILKNEDLADYVVIDTEGGVEDYSDYLMNISDLVIVPTMVGAFDYDQFAKMDAVAKVFAADALEKGFSHCQFRYVMCDVPPKSKRRSGDIDSISQMLQPHFIEPLPLHFKNSALVADAPKVGFPCLVGEVYQEMAREYIANKSSVSAETRNKNRLIYSTLAKNWKEGAKATAQFAECVENVINGKTVQSNSTFNILIDHSDLVNQCPLIVNEETSDHNNA